MNNLNRIERRQRAAKRNRTPVASGEYVTDKGVERVRTLHPTKGYRDRNIDRGLGTQQRKTGIMQFLAGAYRG